MIPEWFDSFNPCISKEENRDLIKEVTEEEILAALSQMSSLKAPSPDGLQASFYQKYWKIVGKSVCKMVRAFFHNGHLLKEINRTFITLIPKLESPEASHHYRPINLCNVSYKIIAKILANRIKPLLNKIISPLQGAFAPGRLINDNIMLAHEIMHSFKKKKGKTGYMVVKLDMEKAYDRLEWEFIKAILTRLGFHPKWIGWVMECISTVSYSVLINGSPEGNIYPSRGIRQGDPLSPYIFIICVEFLGRELVKQAKNPKNHIGIPSHHSGPKIPFLMFAYDCIIFAKASQNACNNINRILKKFCALSGQLVNFRKSTIQISNNIQGTTKRRLGEALSIPTSNGISKYLGCPLVQGRVNRSSFAEVVLKSQKKLAFGKHSFSQELGK